MRRARTWTGRARVWALLLGLTLALAALPLPAPSARAAGQTFTVNSTADPGSGGCTASECTLREAITAANAASGADAIAFNFPDGGSAAGGVKTIRPNAALPAITEAVTIDGYSQSGAQPNTLARGSNAVLRIELSGENLRRNATGGPVDPAGLLIQGASDVVVRGLVINRFKDDFGNGRGVHISGGTGHKLEGNFIGTDATGTLSRVNRDGVVLIGSANSTIGGTAPEQRNVISGNDLFGVRFFGGSAQGNAVQGNLIGTTRDGTTALGNDRGVSVEAPGNVVGGDVAGAVNVISGNSEGVVIAGAGNRVAGNLIGTNAAGTALVSNLTGVRILGADNIIGGTTPAARNVISGNTFDGLVLSGDGATGNTVQGNFIGTTRAGTRALSNDHGVVIEAAGNVVGGTAAGAGNLISGNRFDGVLIEGPRNTVRGNFVGTTKDGTGALGNARFGIELIGASNTAVAGNTIAFNAFAAVGVGIDTSDATTVGNRISRNEIFANGGLGIDLARDFLTANDAGDGDEGPNHLQNKPVLTAATTVGRTTTIEGRLDSTPRTTFVVELFANSSGNEGATFLGQERVTTNAGGRAAFRFVPARAIPAGQKVTATATDPGGNTSEFSAPRTVGQPEGGRRRG